MKFAIEYPLQSETIAIRQFDGTGIIVRIPIFRKVSAQ